MLGLVDYQSDGESGESEGASEGQRDQQHALSQPTTAVNNRAGSDTKISLPDATSLFSSRVDSRLLPA